MEFNTIKGYDNYIVLENGTVINEDTCKELKHDIIDNKYHMVILTKNKKHRKFLVHRLMAKAFIPNPDNKLNVDHIDGNPSNNVISNLRWATDSENQHNRKISKNNKSGTKGVTWAKKEKKWKANIRMDVKQIHLGYFENIEDAIKARHDKAKELYGDFTNKCEL